MVLHSIVTKSLTKSFGDVAAVDDISFSVEDGEIFGFLGTNGAGKSTTVMILTTLLRPTSGRATISGLDVSTDTKKVRQRIGYVQQEVTVDDYLTGRENLELQARLNHVPHDRLDRRIDDALDLIGLSDRQHEPVVTYSGGMKKRLDIAGGLLHRPGVLFLDEPTVGLDIQTRRRIWEHIRAIHDELGMTVFLTTHYMEEADRLCDRVGIIHGGRIQAVGSPAGMKAGMGDDSIRVTVRGSVSAAFVEELRAAGLATGPDGRRRDGGDAQPGGGGPDRLVLFASGDPEEAIPEIFRISSRHGLGIASISLDRPTLDDVFMSYTGREILVDDPESVGRQRSHAGNVTGRGPPP